MNKKFIPLFIFLFIFTGINFVSAVATISGIPNLNLEHNDYAAFSVHTYTTGAVNNRSTTVTFTNPQTGAGVILYGDTGGTHTNNRFSITLTQQGYVQIGSYEIDMTSRPITICVSDQLYTTQDCDTFDLTINENLEPQQTTSFSNYNLTALGGSITLNLNNFFTPFSTFNIGYSDPITSQSVSITRSNGQGTTSYSGGINTIASFSGGIPTIEFQSNSNTFNQKMTLNVSNQYGSAVATFNVSSTTTAITITPTQIAAYSTNYTVLIGNNHTFKVSDFFKDYSVHGTNQYYIDGIFRNDPSNCANGNTLSNSYYPTSSNPTHIVQLRSNSTGDFITITGNNQSYVTIWLMAANLNGACNYNGATQNPLWTNYTVYFVSEISSSGQDLTNQTFINKWTNFMNGWYPDKSELTLKEKWTYVFFTILLLNAFVFIILTVSTKGNINFKFGIFLTLVFTSLAFMWFIAIGYISVTVLVIFSLLIVMYLYMRSGG